MASTSEDPLSLGLDSLIDGEADDDVDAVTPADVLQQLTEAWQNEGAAPELLPHRFDVVDSVLSQIEGMDENLRMYGRNKSLKHDIHKMELDRIIYLNNSYLRRRLDKIENSAALLLEQDERRRRDGLEPKMSSNEQRYAEKYTQLQEDSFKRCVLDQLPVSLQKLELARLAPIANTDELVFAEALETCHGVSVPDPRDDGPGFEQIVVLEKESRTLIPYKSVQSFVYSGDMRLL
uniref:DNA replication complex GINS protein SLD5 n=1 Tax=Plectus sambesii TaxID=2011161 RepID=A0A914USW7_9BILA